MQVLRGSAGITGEHGPFAIGIGIFDGVHKGHQALLLEAKKAGAIEGIACMAYTFDPHPAALLNPALAPRLIEPLKTRLERFASLGLDATLVEPFNEDFACLDAADFVRDVLIGKLQARHVVVGRGFRFGAGQGGDLDLLKRVAQEHGVKVHGVDLVRIDGIEVSSTKIREFVRNGRMKGASLLLGRPFTLSGQVERGAGRGAKIGFATANLLAENELLPAPGVYVGWANGPFETCGTVLNVGYAPTFGAKTLRIEAHLLDYGGGPLYGRTLTLHVVERLRDERRFNDAEALQAQIELDIRQGRGILSRASSGPGSHV